MKINTNAGYERYQSMIQGAKGAEAGSAKKAGAAAAGVAANTDKVMLSENAATHAEMYRLTSALSAEVERSVASDERLADLQARIADGSYHVESQALADAILGYIE